MKRFARRPAPALVIACLALFVSLGGVSYGLATGAIGSREIKNNSVRGKDVRNGSLRGKEVGTDRLGGRTIKEATLGSVPGAEGVTHTAVVRADGLRVRGRGSTGVVRSEVGRYQIAFDRDVRACTYVATVGDVGTGFAGTGVATVSGVSIAPNAVLVRTSTAQNAEPQDRSFHLVVSC